MASIRQRISDYLTFKGLTRYKFYKATGLSNGFLDKEGAITSDKCEIIISVYDDLNPEWLLTGKGEMLRVALPDGAVLSTQKVDEIVKNRSIEVLVDKIVALSNENILLKNENESLKTDLAKQGDVRFGDLSEANVSIYDTAVSDVDLAAQQSVPEPYRKKEE